ncbi:cupin domain-containing protein [Qipengyuania aquimaris]|uniref:cupin domain-containing protein n=1 Tax=Qipengyuania aquimaris TaxID=255984 RepID=UPI0021BD68A9|nr:cupin domain-containing protein [Qipengyuania aquimaris]
MRKLLTIAAPLAAAATLAAGAHAEDTGDALPSALEAGWNGERVCELRHQTDTHRVLRCTFPPGVGHERHYHPAHYGYALSGGTMQLTSENGTRTATLETGSDYSSDGTEWHEVVNVGETTVTYLIVEEI